MLSSGGVQHVMAAVMTCTVLAAIMSTADSVLMGISNTIAVDIYKGWLVPKASPEALVRFGGLSSIICVVTGIILGMSLETKDFGFLLALQNGLSIQVLPSYLLGLYSNVSSRPLICGIAGAFAVIVFTFFLNNPFEPYLSDRVLALMINLAVVLVVQILAPSQDGLGEDAIQCAMREQFGERVDRQRIEELMSTTKEPSRLLLGLMILVGLASIPWYRAAGEQEGIIYGLPTWGFVQCVLFVVMAGIGVAAVCSWQPPPEKTTKEEGKELQRPVFVAVSSCSMSAPGRRSILQTMGDDMALARPLVGNAAHKSAYGAV
jgi:hypothetical protein